VPVTTSTAPGAASSSSTSDWVWWLLAIVVIVAAGITALVLLSKRRLARALAAWRRETDEVLRASLLARGLLPRSGAEITDIAHWESVRVQVTQAAENLEGSSTSAPTNDARKGAHGAAIAFTSVVAALESDRLLRESQLQPTEGQLAESDSLVRTHRQELDFALAKLTDVVRPPAPPSSPTSSL
jgi:hypothetical protein